MFDEQLYGREVQGLRGGEWFRGGSWAFKTRQMAGVFAIRPK